jgi:hypothetical protein
VTEVREKYEETGLERLIVMGYQEDPLTMGKPQEK